jgi:MOSC domain-containing protein YiiM
VTYAALPKTTGRVHEILAGRAIPFGGQATLSAIQKHPITGEVRIPRHGIECDE